MNIEALDIETIWDKDNIAKPIAVAITKNGEVLYKKVSIEKIDSDEIIKFVLETCTTNKSYYVHNLTFEMFVFMRYLIRLNIKFKIISTNKTVYYAEIYFKKKKIKMYCSYRLTMLPLKKLAEICGLEPKGIFPYKLLTENIQEQATVDQTMFNNEEEYTTFIKQHGKNINLFNILESYCKNDTIITKKSIIQYWQMLKEIGFDKGKKKILTAAKLSIEHYFQKNNKILKKIQIQIDRTLRPYYFGGRTEVFGNQYDDEILLHYDWSGMYAQCMQEKVLGGEVTHSNIINDLTHPGFYWITFQQNLDIPILPVKSEKLIFANGIYRGWYWFEEILLAQEMGVKILEVNKVITGQYYDFFLKDFVDKNNAIRKISPIHKIIGKNHNNTFYGRLGMNPEKLEEEIITNMDDKKYKDKKYKKIVETNGIYMGYTETEKSVSNITIAAAITSKARIKLYRGILEVQKNGGRILYTDTDSIIAAFKKNEYKSKLNKHFGEVYFDSTDTSTIIEEAVFAMPKTYAIKYQNGTKIVKIKGFNVKPTYEEFKKKFYNKSSIVTWNEEWNKKDFLIKLIERKKETNLNSLDKRTWDTNMKTTKPLKNIVP